MSCILLVLFICCILTPCLCEKSINVGTVLFTDADNAKDCWSMESIALLTSRMILEDILPSKRVINLNSEDFVTDIIDYFRLILEVVRKLTYGKSKHVMLLALTDVLGGYLNHLVLPLAKHSYYVGNLDYTTIKKLYQLFDELKCFLRTNGRGWSKPITLNDKMVRARVIPIQPPTSKTDPCKGLIYYEGPQAGSLEHRKKRSNCDLTIPMPFLDSKSHPSAIAVPFKTYSLRNIESKAAAYLLMKYYVASYKCLLSKHVKQRSMERFENTLYNWMTKQVLPRLADEKFYSAFGGVFRILETFKESGVVGQNKEMGNYNLMPEIEDKEPEVEEEGEEGDSALGGRKAILSPPGSSGGEKHKRSTLILMALLCTIFIWFLLGALFICYRIRASKEKKQDDLKKIEQTKSSESRTSSSTSTKSKISPLTHKKSSSTSKSSKSSKGSEKKKLGGTLSFAKDTKKVTDETTTKATSETEEETTDDIQFEKRKSIALTPDSRLIIRKNIGKGGDYDESGITSSQTRNNLETTEEESEPSPENIISIPMERDASRHSLTPKRRGPSKQSILSRKSSQSVKMNNQGSKMKLDDVSRRSSQQSHLKLEESGRGSSESRKTFNTTTSGESKESKMAVESGIIKQSSDHLRKDDIISTIPSKIPTPRRNKDSKNSLSRDSSLTRKDQLDSKIEIKGKSDSKFGMASFRPTKDLLELKRNSPITTPKGGSPRRIWSDSAEKRATLTTQARGRISEEISTDEDVSYIPYPSAPSKVDYNDGTKLSAGDKSHLPKSCACHTSMSGKYVTDSIHDPKGLKFNKEPLVFGYDIQTTTSTDTSPRGTSDGGDTDMTHGNMSK